MDYLRKSEIRKLFAERGMPEGACFGSKTRYKERNHENEVIFNALIYLSGPYHDLLTEGKLDFSFMGSSDNYGKLEEYQLWHGDLDLTKSKNSLEEIAKKLGEDLVVTDEFTKKQKDIKI